MGLERDAVREGLRTFAGVPHRLERVAEIGGVLYVNDSKATNVGAAAAALRSFDGGVRAILGGSLKGGDFEGLVEPVSRALRCLLPDRRRRRPRWSGTWSPPARPAWSFAAATGSPTRCARRPPTRAPGEVVAARAGVRELRRLPGLRGARRALPLAGRGSLDA